MPSSTDPVGEAWAGKPGPVIPASSTLPARPPSGHHRRCRAPIDLVDIEASRVELRLRVKVKPLQHLLVLLVSWVGKHLAQMLISPKRRHSPRLGGRPYPRGRQGNAHPARRRAVKLLSQQSVLERPAS
ncbi:MAG TPA: hypothetical protein VK680_02155 [Solirubrobacteraceae bacterium]|nr:hypothetical protein [Solirubrobacteraceae bacterium]